MTKTIIDPQVKELIERLKGLAQKWMTVEFNDGYHYSDRNAGREKGHEMCAADLQYVIDNYLNKPGPKVEVEFPVDEYSPEGYPKNSKPLIAAAKKMLEKDKDLVKAAKEFLNDR